MLSMAFRNHSKVTIISLLFGFLLNAIFSNPVIYAASCSDPNNAASLYFQAFEELPIKTLAESQAWDLFMADHNNISVTLRGYLDKCQPSLELARAATDIQYCDWGHDISQGVNGYLRSIHLSDIRKLVFVIYGEAVKQAHDGNQMIAIKYALMLQQIAEHTGTDSMIVQLSFTSINNYAAKTLRMILGYSPATTETLTGLQSQFVTRQSCIQAFFESIDSEFLLSLETAKYDDIFSLAREEASTGDYPGKIESMTDDELLEYISKPMRYYTDKMKQLAALDMPVSQIVEEIEQVEEQVQQTYQNEYPSCVRWYFYPGSAYTRTYVLSVRGDAEFAVMQSAIELYDMVAQTGELPDELPDYLPKDPFTGSAFEYEITSMGFILRFIEQDSPEGGTLFEKEFTVPALSNN